MLAGARTHRGSLPVAAISLRHDGGAQVADWVRHELEHHRNGTLKAQDVGPPVPHTHADGTVHAHA